ncbi:hemolysin, partial [Rhizobium leguminosarum]
MSDSAGGLSDYVWILAVFLLVAANGFFVAAASSATRLRLTDTRANSA